MLDTLLLFVNYSEGDGGNGGGPRSGRDSPLRVGSPDSANNFNTAQLLKEAVEAYSEIKGKEYVWYYLTCFSLSLSSHN